MTEIEKDLGFVILLTEFRFGGLRATTATINSNFNNARYICSIPADSNEGDVKIAKTICPIVKGKNTISSMINVGIEKSERPWNLIVMSGNIIRHKPVMRYGRWIESKKDIMYRVTDKVRWKWEDASIHGMLIHKDAIREVGDFLEEESLPACKMEWATRAIQKDYKFKGIVGVRLT